MRKTSMLEVILSVAQIGLLYKQLLFSQEKVIESESQKQEMALLILIICVFWYKTKTEGNRWYIIIWLASISLSMYHKLFHSFTQVEVLYLSSFLAALHIILIYLFPIYEIPKLIQYNDSSKSLHTFNVSCNTFILKDEDSLHVTVFYPTEEETGKGQGDLYMFESDYWNHIYTSIKRDFKIPFFILDLVLSAIKKYKVRIEANHPIIKAQNLKPIIFSHGFMGSRTMYSIIVKQLASLGYVIFCVEHRDMIKEDDVDNEADKNKKKIILKDLKEKELDTRVSKVKTVIDLIQKENELNKLSGQSFSLDKSSIVLMGHSYGGATAQCSAFRYPQHVKGLICLDPWLFPMRDEYLQQKLNIPLLFINSETFSSTMKWAEVDERNAKIFQNCQQPLKSFNCYIKDMDHVQQGDIGLIIPTEGKLVNIIRYPTRTLEFNLYNAKLAEIFLKNIIFSKKNEQQTSTQTLDHKQIINENIFVPLKRDSYQYFRQEFLQNFDEKRGMYCLNFRGKSPF